MSRLPESLDGVHPYFAQRPSTPLVIIPGTRPLPESVTLLLNDYHSPLWVIEPNVSRWSYWNQTFTGADVQIVRDIADLLNRLSPHQSFELYAVVNEGTSANVTTLFARRAPELVCGVIEKSAGDWLHWYQLAAASCQNFIWYVIEQGSYVSGKLSSVPVSVVVPVYNVMEWLDECLLSLSEQDLDGLEIIVVNDGSTDGSGEKAERWRSKYPEKFRVIHQNNSGCASARNAGLVAANGQFIGFVDSDDFVSPDMFSSLFRAAILQRADVAQCGWTEFYPNGKKVVMPADRYANLHDELSSRPSIWRRIYRTSLLREKKIIFPPHIRRFDDLPFQFEALLAAQTMTSIESCLYFYRQARPGQDISVRDERLFVHAELFDWLFPRVAPAMTRRVAHQYFRLLLNTHRWAWSIIDGTLKNAYLNLIHKQCQCVESSLSFTERVLLAARMGRHSFTFFLRLNIKASRMRRKL